MKGKSDSVRNYAQYCIVSAQCARNTSWTPSYKARILSMKYTDELDDLLRLLLGRKGMLLLFLRRHTKMSPNRLKSSHGKEGKKFGKIDILIIKLFMQSPLREGAL